MVIFGNIKIKVMKKLFKKLFTKKKTHFYPTDVWSEISDKYKIKEKLWKTIKEIYEPEELGTGLVIYGEIHGPGIQKNFDYGLKEIDFVGFDCSLNGIYQNVDFTQAFFEALGLKHVEILHDGIWSQEIQDKFVFNNFITGTKVPHEGVVIKHVSGDRQKVAKVINPDYLIYGEKHDVGDSH
jgi:hypothetical protein